MIAGLLFLQFVLLGVQAVAPWRLAAGGEAPRRLWALVALPLLLLSGILALLHLRLTPDAALTWGLAWPPRALPAKLLLVLIVAGAGATLVVALGWKQLEPVGFRIAAGLNLLLAAGAAFAGELLRTGQGPASGFTLLTLAAAGRLALTLAAGESVTGSPRWLAPIGALLLPLSLFAAPAALRPHLMRDGLTLLAASLLLLAARFLPPSLRRPAALAGVALGALFLARSAELSAMLETRPTVPDLFFPEP